MRPCIRTRAARFSSPTPIDHWIKVKFTMMSVMTSTGSPFSSVGLYFYCRIASSAALTSMGCPRTN